MTGFRAALRLGSLTSPGDINRRHNCAFQTNAYDFEQA
jgi:hypothetical protein